MIFSPSFVGFPAIFISDSAPDEPARVIAAQITCPQDTQTLLDLSCTQYFQIQLRLIIPLIIASWICSWWSGVNSQLGSNVYKCNLQVQPLF